MESKIIDFLATKSIIDDFILHYAEYYMCFFHYISLLNLSCDDITIVEVDCDSNLSGIYSLISALMKTAVKLNRFRVWMNNFASFVYMTIFFIYA